MLGCCCTALPAALLLRLLWRLLHRFAKSREEREEDAEEEERERERALHYDGMEDAPPGQAGSDHTAHGGE